MDISAFANVVGVTPDLVQIEIVSTHAYERLPRKLEIGSYLKIFNQGGPSLVAVVRSYRLKDVTDSSSRDHDGKTELQVVFVLDTQPVGVLENGKFHRGGGGIPIPPKNVEIANSKVLEEVYSGSTAGSRFAFSKLVHDSAVAVEVDGDKFFGRHIGVVGSTGSGKSGAVAKMLQEAVGNSDMLPVWRNNSHILIFDVHGEYPSAFPDARVLTVDDLALPYWLMNSEELVDMFIDSNEENSHNQISQFRQAVLENKRRHARMAGQILDITYDTPCYFDLREVVNYLANQNTEIVYRGEDGPHGPKLTDGTLVTDPSEYYFDRILRFTPSSPSGAKKATTGPFYGEFSRLVMRLEARLGDTRLAFLLDPKLDGNVPKTEDREALLRSYLGYSPGREVNVTIVDLSGVPFEALSIVVSLLSRMVFAFNFQYQRTRGSGEPPFPFLLVLEEAHNYVPKDDSAKFKSVKRSIERIAKEGRKYGMSLMVVSQRPSEVSETIFSQCGNFVAMRLTNPADQAYVRRLLPDSLAAVTDALPTLRQREAVLLGDAVAIPSLVLIDELIDKPNSSDIEFLREWRREWMDMNFAGP